MDHPAVNNHYLSLFIYAFVYISSSLVSFMNHFDTLIHIPCLMSFMRLFIFCLFLCYLIIFLPCNFCCIPYLTIYAITSILSLVSYESSWDIFIHTLSLVSFVNHLDIRLFVFLVSQFIHFSTYIPSCHTFISIASLLSYILILMHTIPLHWRHIDHNSVSNHQPHDCLLNHLFGRRSKKWSKLRVTGLCAGNSPGPVNSPHKGPVTRKMFPFDDVIMTPKVCCCQYDS